MPAPLPITPGGPVLGGEAPLFILGPCVIESEAFTWRMARALKAVVDGLGEPASAAGCANSAASAEPAAGSTAARPGFVFKASYDKANRTAHDAFRGVPIREGCQLLADIGRELGVPVTTDVHSPQEAEIAAEYIDILQIPAFLCRQTDLICAAARTGRVVNVKKGQFLAPHDMRNVGAKLRQFGCERFFFTERGASFGYNNLVADMRSLFWMREDGFLTVFDATHSVQRPGGGGDRTSGDGELAPVLARAAVAAGCDGVFIETHEEPSKALSDGPNQIPLAALPALLRKLVAMHALAR